MVLHENYLICIFMNINENFKNRDRTRGNWGFWTYTEQDFLCMPFCSMQPLKCEDIVINNEIHFDYVKFHGFNGNTLCGVKNGVYI